MKLQLQLALVRNRSKASNLLRMAHACLVSSLIHLKIRKNINRPHFRLLQAIHFRS